MKTIYLECNMGAAGDMLMASLYEICPDKERFLKMMNEMGLPGLSVEAEPSVDDVLEKVKAGDYERVVLEPLMVVAGDHANNDMAGDDPDSWKSVFEAEGYDVECLIRGLGENEEIRKIYAEHAQKAIDSIK